MPLLEIFVYTFPTKNIQKTKKLLRLAEKHFKIELSYSVSSFNHLLLFFRIGLKVHQISL